MIDDFKFFDWQGEKINLFQRLDLAITNQTSKLGHRNPLLIGILATTTSAATTTASSSPTSSSSTTFTSATATTASETATKSSSATTGWSRSIRHSVDKKHKVKILFDKILSQT